LREGSIFYLWFNAGANAAPRNYDDIKSADADTFVKFFRSLLDQGVSMAPSAFEVGFISAAHETKHLEATVTAMDKALSIACT